MPSSEKLITESERLKNKPLASTGMGRLTKRPKILIAEGDDSLRQSLKEVFVRRGFGVHDSSDQTSVLQIVPNPSIDLIIIGSFENSAWAGLEVARQIRTLDREVPIILIASKTSEELAVAALRTGINDYFRQPFPFEELVSSVTRRLSHLFPWSPQQNTKGPESDIIDGNRMIGKSLALREIRAAVGTIASTDSNLLITGETGTGKELVAELIHRNSPRAQKPFVCINCAAIPDTLLESELFGYERGSFTGAYSSNKGKLKFGDGGTIFFDEIGDMSPHAQAKILRVIESREVQRLGGQRNIPLNVRFIAASNRDLERSVSEEKFRKDLYFRLNVASIHLPPLRERKEDIPFLSDHYIREFNGRFGRKVEGFTEEALEFLLRYDWPGNVRELKNLLETTVANFRHRQISFKDLPEQYRRRLREIKDLPQNDQLPLLSVLISTNWNISKAAQKLHWSRMTVYRKMAKYHINRKEKCNIDLIQRDSTM
jgi:DNA-binding NtrC family response regulator